MNILAWILQILLAVAFLGAGFMKLTQPKEKLRATMTWVDHFSAGQVKGVGALEALGGLGLVLPWATGIAPVLTPLAAVGLVLVMIGAIVTHLRLKDPVGQAAPAAILGALSLVVALLRF